MWSLTISTMKIDRLERSKHVSGRILVFLEDGGLIKVTEQELLDFGLRAGDELDEAALERLRAAADGSNAKAQAAALIGRRAMSRRDLEKKLMEKGASGREAAYAAEWMEAIGGLDDAAYAAMLVRHCAQRGYGPARYRDELYKHGVDRALWEDAIDAAPPAEELAAAFLRSRFRKGPPEDKDRKRAADALARRGFGWEDVKTALRRVEAELEEA